MASTKVKAIVIKTKDLKEKDKLITLWTLEQGKITASLRGVRGANAKFKFAKEPFCFGEFVIENTKGMNVVTQVEIVDSFFGLTQDIDKFYEACAIIDAINILENEQADAQVFIETLKALKALCYEKIKKYYVFNTFMLKLFKNMGYFFVSENCSACRNSLMARRFFNLDIGEFVCFSCKNYSSVEVSDAFFSAIKILNNHNYDDLSKLNLGGNAEKELYRLIDKNFEWRFGKRFCQIL